MAVRAICFRSHRRISRNWVKLQRQHSAAVAAGDLLTVFLQQPQFSPVAVRPVRQCLPDRDHRSVGTKVYGNPLYAHAFPNRSTRPVRDHLDMIKALRRVTSRRPW